MAPRRRAGRGARRRRSRATTRSRCSRGSRAPRQSARCTGPQVAALAAREEVDLAVVGPEAPLAAGVADALAAAGVHVFGPTAAAARIESSKAFCRSVAEEAGARVARGAAFGAGGEAAALAFAVDLDRSGARVVVKADGLMAGKGVTVCDDLLAAREAIAALYAQERAHGRSAEQALRPGRA